jgi:hypothetical protein
MPWKASSVMEERLHFVARLLDGKAMTDVCRDFGVSRKTGYNPRCTAPPIFLPPTSWPGSYWAIMTTGEGFRTDTYVKA